MLRLKSVNTRFCLVGLSIFLAPSAQAEIFKCVQNGKTTFSQQPCAANAQLVELDVHQPSAQSVKEQAAIHAGMQAHSNRIERDYGALVLQRRIADSAAAIAEMMRERDARLADLRAQKNATKKDKEKELITLEINRVKDAYATEIALEKDRKKQLEKELVLLSRAR
ncbi:MAG: DUF4124 domain-containing protein [Halothiobacillaceae bacterium]